MVHYALYTQAFYVNVTWFGGVSVSRYQVVSTGMYDSLSADT